MRPVHTDCRHYVGNRPCVPHKREGVLCPGCPHYDPVQERLLVVKLAAIGDVLRTMAILPALRARFPNGHVTWLTEPQAVPLFYHHPQVDRVLVPSAETVVLLQCERFDQCYGLDLDPVACALTATVRAAEVWGFTRDERGAVVAHGPGAEQWYEMSLWDDCKRANEETYQAHLFRTAGLVFQGERPQLVLTEEERACARGRLADTQCPRVGLNLGGGGRWRHKRWTLEGFVELARRLSATGATIVLFYGPDEQSFAESVQRAMAVPFIDARPDNSLRDFAALVGECDLLVTGDTLAMHLAIAQDVPVVVLFGPTSAAEIDLYGRGEAVVAELPCQCCYLPDCDVRPTCMESILPERVFAACLRWLPKSLCTAPPE